MGRDKALLEFHGLPQIEYIDGLLRTFCGEVFLSQREDQKPYKNIPFITDAPEFSGQGPTGGILSAMRKYPDVSWLVLACDLPFVTDETIQTILNLRNAQKTATAFISSSDGLPEPLCALWEGHAYRPVLKLFNEGIHCPRKILIKSDTCLLKQTNPHWLDNVNTPQEYEQVKSFKY